MYLRTCNFSLRRTGKYISKVDDNLKIGRLHLRVAKCRKISLPMRCLVFHVELHHKISRDNIISWRCNIIQTSKAIRKLLLDCNKRTTF